MLPPDYRWEELGGGRALYLDGVVPHPYRCAEWGTIPGGVMLHWGVRDCRPNQRHFSSEQVATKFAEAWALKWDSDIRSIVANKGQSYGVAPITEQVSREAASRDYKRRHGRRKNWWRESG